MLGDVVTFCPDCGHMINRRMVSPEILKFRKNKCIKCFLKSKKKADIEYCRHKGECRYFSEDFCIVGDKENGWYEYTLSPDGSNRCFREKFK
jgi:hypothetical protein